jgi:hypothetical protein
MESLTRLKIGDIVEHDDSDEYKHYVYGYVVGMTGDHSSYSIRWFDGHPDTNHDVFLLKKVEKLDDITGW